MMDHTAPAGQSSSHVETNVEFDGQVLLQRTPSQHKGSSASNEKKRCDMVPQS